MNYDDLLDVFVPSEYEHTQITIKIPVGSSVDDVIAVFLENGIGTREGFEEVINHHEFDTEKYWFLNELPENVVFRYAGTKAQWKQVLFYSEEDRALVEAFVVFEGE